MVSVLDRTATRRPIARRQLVLYSTVAEESRLKNYHLRLNPFKMNTIKGLQTPVTAVDATDPESTGSQPPASPSPSTSVTYTAADLKSARRKVDLRLVVWYSFMYLILMIHKGNISNAAIINLESGDGIREELGGLTSSQWAWAISIFYYPYMLAEPAATLALKKFNPNVWMARIMITWGVISMCQGATQNFEGLMACRFFLGLAEAGFYPGVLYHFSFWLPPDSMPLRIVRERNCQCLLTLLTMLRLSSTRAESFTEP